VRAQSWMILSQTRLGKNNMVGDKNLTFGVEGKS
jgi:hypothetical protein